MLLWLVPYFGWFHTCQKGKIMKQFIGKSLLLSLVSAFFIAQGTAQTGNLTMTTDTANSPQIGFDDICINGLSTTPPGSVIWELRRRIYPTWEEESVQYGGGPAPYTVPLLKCDLSSTHTLMMNGSGPKIYQRLFYPYGTVLGPSLTPGPLGGDGYAAGQYNTLAFLKTVIANGGPRYYQYVTEYNGYQWFGKQCGPAPVRSYTY
jgi:hypothetical protein